MAKLSLRFDNNDVFKSHINWVQKWYFGNYFQFHEINYNCNTRFDTYIK